METVRYTLSSDTDDNFYLVATNLFEIQDSVAQLLSLGFKLEDLKIRRDTVTSEIFKVSDYQ